MTDVVPVPGEYPIVLSIGRPPSGNRFWAIPIIGICVKLFILIPHLIILGSVSYATVVSALVIWIPVLFGGRYPQWAFDLTAGYLRWSTRIALFIYGVSDVYPAFSFEAPGDIYIERPESSSRFFAIPIIGVLIKAVILIPHFIVLYALAIAVFFCQLVIWIPVLFMEQYPGWAFTLVAGTTLWSVRVNGYLFGLSDRYPPFSFS